MRLLRNLLTSVLICAAVTAGMTAAPAAAAPRRLTWHVTATDNRTGRAYNLDRASGRAAYTRATTSCDTSVHDYTLRQGGYYGATEVVAASIRERWSQITCGSINNQGVIIYQQWTSHGEVGFFHFCQQQTIYNLYAPFGGKPYGQHNLYVRFKWDGNGGPCGQVASVDTVLIVDYTHHVSQGRSYCVLPGCVYSGSANEQFSSRGDSPAGRPAGGSVPAQNMTTPGPLLGPDVRQALPAASVTHQTR